MACTDIFGLFDGIAFDQKNVPVFLQIKTNSWANWNAIKAFCLNRQLDVLFINVKDGKAETRAI